jgi:hypothetical protein
MVVEVYEKNKFAAVRLRAGDGLLLLFVRGRHVFAL